MPGSVCWLPEMKGRRCRDDYLSDILKNDFRLKDKIMVKKRKNSRIAVVSY